MSATVSRNPICNRPGWHSRLLPSGWLDIWQIREDGDSDVLVKNAQRRGPGKFLRTENRIQERFEYYLGRSGDLEALIDPEAAEAQTRLRQELIDPVFASEEKAEAPSAAQMSRWLGDAGFEPAIDKDGNLRLTLKRPGCDGGVRIERSEDRVCMSLALGSWPQLAPASEKAMRLVAEFVNAHTRLARIALFREGEARRFEAQVDLTGMPVCDDAAHERLWQLMMPLGVKALDLSLRQLGLELSLLADNPDVAHVVLASANVVTDTGTGSVS